MDSSKLYAIAQNHSAATLGFTPESAVVNSVWMDSECVPDCMFNQASWITSACTRKGLIKHTSDCLMMFIGGNPNDKENLNAEIEISIENDRHVLKNTCFVFVPAGAAYGDITVKNLKTPVFYYTLLLNSSDYTFSEAAATAPAGKYAGNVVEKYAPVDGRIPEAPPGFVDFLLWIDDAKLSGAPYMEAVWFKKDNDTGPAGHVHNFDEVIGFIGSDPEHPEDLGAEVEFVLGERIIKIHNSALFYVPRGTSHSPIIVPKLTRPIYHFSGGNGGNYSR